MQQNLQRSSVELRWEWRLGCPPPPPPNPLGRMTGSPTPWQSSLPLLVSIYMASYMYTRDEVGLAYPSQYVSDCTKLLQSSQLFLFCVCVTLHKSN